MTAKPGNPDAVYPPVWKMPDGSSIDLSADTALMRLNEYMGERYGYNEDGYLNVPDDLFTRDLLVLLSQASAAIAYIEIIATGAFTSCQHEDAYAGGVKSPGNRIYTPQEAAKNALEQVRALEKR